MVIPGVDRIGGAERQAILLAKGLRRRRWRVTLVALAGSGGAAAEELHSAGIEFLSLQMRHGLLDPCGWVRFNRWLWREQPDVVHAHLPHAAWLARWSRLAAPVPVVIDTLHSSATGPLRRHAGYALSRWLPDQVTAVSNATAAAHSAARMVSDLQLKVIPNGVETSAWRADPHVRAEARRELGVNDEFVWLAVGRLEAVKDYPVLLAAMAILPRRARLVVLGDGPLEWQLVLLSRKLGLERRVRFMGFDSAVHRWMQAADGLVLASRYEGLPMVLLEAGACGVPVVATNVAGTRELVVNGETGWLACGDGADALAAVLHRVMRLPAEERRAMGERARRLVYKHYAMKAVLDQWEELYDDLLERKTARGKRLSFTRQSPTHA
jgi:glycosyltransferase involved in cell wall biosynthesis